MNINKSIKWCDYPKSQKKICNNNDKYLFERKRVGNNVITEKGEVFGPYLYRNIMNNVLVASWEQPLINQITYKGYDIGTHIDALVYYKNN